MSVETQAMPPKKSDRSLTNTKVPTDLVEWAREIAFIDKREMASIFDEAMRDNLSRMHQDAVARFAERIKKAKKRPPD